MFGRQSILKQPRNLFILCIGTHCPSTFYTTSNKASRNGACVLLPLVLLRCSQTIYLVLFSWSKKKADRVTISKLQGGAHKVSNYRNYRQFHRKLPLYRRRFSWNYAFSSPPHGLISEYLPQYTWIIVSKPQKLSNTEYCNIVRPSLTNLHAHEIVFAIWAHMTIDPFTS